MKQKIKVLSIGLVNERKFPLYVLYFWISSTPHLAVGLYILPLEASQPFSS